MKQPNKFLPVHVNVVLSINEEEVHRNISTNLDTIPKHLWYNKLFYPNDFQAVIISAGPSMEKYVTELKLKEKMEMPNRRFVVFCVKHALPRLMKMGIEPDFCVILDGRPLDGISTHGEHRKSLFKEIPKNTVFLVASMSHPDYAKYLLDSGANVMGWHTAVKGLEKFADRIGEALVVNGGTSSGTRAISLAHNFGCRHVTLVGFDSCIHDVTPEILNTKDDKGRPKYHPVDLPTKMVVTKDQQKMLIDLTESYAKLGLVYSSTIAKRFYTTGELLAQAQDFETVFTTNNLDIRFEVLDDGIVNHMFNSLRTPGTGRGESFAEYFRAAIPRNNVREAVKKKVVLSTTKETTKGKKADGKKKKAV